ncbi:MAG: hypothetical protein O3B73_15605 [bacterium]|nr:hypothetical protein [bacterium]
MSTSLSVVVDHVKTHMTASILNGHVYVPLDAFCAQIYAEAKTQDIGGLLAVCREHVCVPLNVSGTEDTVTIEGIVLGRLAAFAEPLGLHWTEGNGSLEVVSGQGGMGLGIGHMPPPFSLPDVYSAEPISSRDYHGRKAVFYMWASW